MFRLPSIIAHRGGRNWAPENTLAAFHRSVSARVGGVEFDVHRCSTGELVVIHDDTIDRTTNGVGMVKDSSLGELKRLSAGLWFDKEFREERVPLLTEVLDLFNEEMVIDIELKNSPVGYDGIEEDLLYTIEPYRSKLNILVSSFDHHCLRRLRALDSEIEIGVLVGGGLIDIKEYAGKLNARYLIQEYDCLMPEAVADAKDAGLKIVVWTVNDAPKWQRLIELGVDGICTDTPAELAAFYEECLLHLNVANG